jgi:hypothetical protein
MQRLEPIGYDAARNSYYLLGGDRIWIQRSPPRKPRKSAKKAKTAPPKKKAPVKPATQPVNSRKRPASPEVQQSNTRSSKRIKAGQKISSAIATPTSQSSRPSRAAAADANKKLAALPKTTMTSRAFRATSRRSREEDEVWQEIPDEWLHPAADEDEGEEVEAEPSSPQAEEDGETKPDPVAEDAVSELTALSELSELSELSDEEEKDKPPLQEEADEAEKQDDPEPKDEPETEPALPAGFIEWETVRIVHDRKTEN